MGALQGNLQTAGLIKFSIGANAITTTASSTSVVPIQIGGVDPTTDMAISVQPTAIGNFTSSYIPTINAVVTAPGVVTLYITNGSSAHSTVIAANSIFTMAIARQENGFIQNFLG